MKLINSRKNAWYSGSSGTPVNYIKYCYKDQSVQYDSALSSGEFSVNNDLKHDPRDELYSTLFNLMLEHRERQVQEQKGQTI